MVLGEQTTIQEMVLPTGDQRYTIAVPAGYTGDQPVPLVLALHYGGEVTPFFSRTILVELIEPAWRELGAIIVAPDCPTNSWTDPRSEKVVLELLAFVEKNYAVDAQRRLITGYSMGGAGTWYLAARNPDRFSAAVIMAGWPPQAIEDVEWKTPLVIIHSRQDEIVPLQPTEDIVNTLQVKGAPVKLVVLDGITHYEMFRFVEPLRKTASWVESVWRR
ncbi:alpha/beta fold hydrolase [Chloroflexota bacterium]